MGATFSKEETDLAWITIISGTISTCYTAWYIHACLGNFILIPDWNMNFRLPKHVWVFTVFSACLTTAAVIGSLQSAAKAGTAGAFVAPIVKAITTIVEWLGMFKKRPFFPDRTRVLLGFNLSCCREDWETDEVIEKFKNEIEEQKARALQAKEARASADKEMKERGATGV